MTLEQLAEKANLPVTPHGAYVVLEEDRYWVGEHNGKLVLLDVRLTLWNARKIGRAFPMTEGGLAKQRQQLAQWKRQIGEA